MSWTVDRIAAEIMTRAGSAKRFMIAIAGPPGSGKSTMADRLAQTLRHQQQSAEILPMDGFHMDNGVLQDKGLLARKGAPETFDVRAFVDIVKAVKKADQEVLVPVFDRSREIAIASARSLSPEHRFILVEGNYLLCNQEPWRELDGLFDFSVLLTPPLPILEQRLWDRWKGYNFTDEAAHAKVYGNDLPNGRFVLENRRPADLDIASYEA